MFIKICFNKIIKIPQTGWIVLHPVTKLFYEHKFLTLPNPLDTSVKRQNFKLTSAT